MRKFNLSLDDMSPHENAGLDFESIKWCNKIIETYPNFKINLFVPAAYCRLGEKKPNYLSEYPEWINKVNSLQKNNYRINLHGLYHRRSIKDSFYHQNRAESNNDEFQYLDDSAAWNIGDKMIREFKKAKLDFITTFRPPGWKISLHAMLGLDKLGVTCFAGSQEYYDKWKNTIKSMNIKWVSYNWDLLAEPQKEGNIVAYGHTSNWTTNFMNEQRYNTIMNFLKDRQFEFAFIEDM